MGHVVRGHMIVISVVILAFLVISGRKVDVRIRTPQNFDIQCDATLTDSAKAIITQFIENLDKRIALHPAIFASIIKEQFPFIQAIQSRLVPPGTMKLNCTAYQPLCTINQVLLLVPPHTLCHTDYYCKSLVSELPNIIIDESQLKTHDTKTLVSVVKTLNKDIFAQFQVAVSSDSTIVFEDKIQPRLSMICRADNVPATTLCMHGKYMKELLENRHAFTGKSNNHFIADLRFGKQIILSKK